MWNMPITRGTQLVELVSEVVKRFDREYFPSRKKLSPICLEVEGRVTKETNDNTTTALADRLCPYQVAI